MQIPVLLERMARNGYRARSLEPFAVSAKGATRADALAKLRAKVKGRLKNGAELVGLDVGAPADPWTPFGNGAGLCRGTERPGHIGGHCRRTVVRVLRSVAVGKKARTFGLG